ncbi:hypothetical protein LCM23_13160 [Cytobacillus kochii]|uniref:hypothetical protein n=1 Tax=Cytobacillus kochii TaxID=859143 RepID=UPI001CD5BCC6|nr:hypothetical protein [Cytobacillus kochii]MCA1027044.1 hypothetical protein [Cytobacillus kochii]
MFEKFKRKRVLKEVSRLKNLLSKDGTGLSTAKEIARQIRMCELMPWDEYKKFFRIY